MTLDNIKNEPLKDDFARFEEELGAALSKQAEYLTENELNLYRGGKRLRPVLLLLFARMAAGVENPLPRKVIRGAAAVEMLHVASLIHDDIVDNSATRRKLPTVSSDRGVGTAVIVGDMQFLLSIRGFVDTIDVQEDMGLVSFVLDTAYDVCRGELDELNARKTDDIQLLKERYLKIIKRKTAALFGLACECGVRLGGGRLSDARRAGFFGRSLGTAFQITDDLLDCVYTQAGGKDGGADLRNGVITLPLILSAEILGEYSASAEVLRGANDEMTLNRAGREILTSGGADTAYSAARGFIQDAHEFLSFFPDNGYKHAAACIADYVIRGK